MILVSLLVKRKTNLGHHHVSQLLFMTIFLSLSRSFHFHQSVTWMVPTVSVHAKWCPVLGSYSFLAPFEWFLSGHIITLPTVIISGYNNTLLEWTSIAHVKEYLSSVLMFSSLFGFNGLSMSVSNILPVPLSCPCILHSIGMYTIGIPPVRYTLYWSVPYPNFLVFPLCLLSLVDHSCNTLPECFWSIHLTLYWSEIVLII